MTLVAYLLWHLLLLPVILRSLFSKLTTNDSQFRFLWVPMYCNFCKIKCNCTILISSTQQSLIQKSWSRSQYHLPWYHMKGFSIRDWNKIKWIIYIYCQIWREIWLFVQPRKFMSPEGEARGRYKFSGLNKSSCPPTNCAINRLLYWKLKHKIIQPRALCHAIRQ